MRVRVQLYIERIDSGFFSPRRVLIQEFLDSNALFLDSIGSKPILLYVGY